MNPKFGRRIDRNKAQEHYRDFIEVKKNSVEKIRLALSGDIRSSRYYCGREDLLPTHEDLAFIFDKEAIQHLLDKLNNGEADGIALLPGLRELGDSPPESNETTDGRPTVMMFSYTYLDPVNRTDSPIQLSLDDGSEHPGTGGKGGGGPLHRTGEFDLPEIFEPGEVRPAPPAPTPLN